MRLLLVALILVALALLSGCDRPAAQTNEAQRQPRPHLVELFTVQIEKVRLDRVRTGTLRASKRFQLFTQEEGQLASLPWYPGDWVNQDAVLMALDDSLLRSQINRSQAELDRAERDLERVRALSQRNLTSVEELQRRETELEIARADLAILMTRLGFTQMQAPFAGVVTQRHSEPGNFVSKNTHLLTLIDPQSLVVDVELSENILAQLSLGDAVEIQLDALGSQVFSGEIKRIYPEVDPLTRRGNVEVTPDSVPAGALPGQLARVSLSANLQQRMMIPFSALRYEQGEYVYLMDNQQRIHKRHVVTGMRIGNRIEILKGLEAEDQVVVRGFMGLTEGRTVTPVTPLSEREG